MKGYYQYAADVRDGKIVVGEFIKQAVERFYVLFERDDIDFRENRADYAIEFISLLRHYTGRHAGKSFTLLPWQEFAVASIYGFYKKMRMALGAGWFRLYTLRWPVKWQVGFCGCTLSISSYRRWRVGCGSLLGG